MNIRRILNAIACFILLPSLLHGLEYVTRHGVAAGTFINITVEKKEGSSLILDEAFTRIKGMERLFSVYDRNSEISILNRKGKHEVSDEMIRLLEKSVSISVITKGAFDVTCKPLIDLYRKAEKRDVEPSEQEISGALKNVGWKKIRINGNMVRLQKGMEIDLGAIAKGYIVDRTAEFLKGKGIKNALIDAGGDIYAYGINPHGRKWQIGIRNPFRKNSFIKRIGISDRGVATSGDYERFYTIKKKKYGHIVNPSTGKSVQDYPAGVTVIAPDCTTADALATAFFVMGPGPAVRLADKMNGIGVLIIDRGGKTYMNSGFSNLCLP